MRRVTVSLTSTSGWRTSLVGDRPASAPESAWKKYDQNARLSASLIFLKRGQNGLTSRATLDESSSGGSASSTIWSHAGSQVGLPSSSFLIAMGVVFFHLRLFGCGGGRHGLSGDL